VAILVTNDDGVSSTGIRALAAALSTLDDVWIVAPDRDQSAVSHSVTLQRPLRIDEFGERIYAIDGTPTDCVILAVRGIMKEAPRLVVSGINHGANLGDDVTYSGTVSAAMEATLLGIPAIAISQVGRSDFDFTAAAAFAARLAQDSLRDGLPPDTLLNVNVPSGSAAAIPGFRLTYQGKRRYTEAVIEKADPRGRKYYWIGGSEPKVEAPDGSDFAAIKAGYISVTPLHLDLTNYASLERLKTMHVESAPKGT